MASATDEYDLDEVLREDVKSQPLSLASSLSSSMRRGPSGVLELTFAADPDPERACAFVTVSSSFYPELSERYERWVPAWCTSAEGKRGTS